MNDFAKGFAVATLLAAGVSWAMDGSNGSLVIRQGDPYDVKCTNCGYADSLVIGQNYIMAECYARDKKTGVMKQIVR